MWIKTKGGYLLNIDNVDFVHEMDGNTYAFIGKQRFLITNENIINRISNNLRRGTTIMEVE
jgi:hypothetical protein